MKDMKTSVKNMSARELRPRVLLAGLVAQVVLGFACSSPPPLEQEEPPTFNAVDSSVTCPAGQVGWDFSTGGATDEDALNGATLEGIRVQQALYGYNAVNLVSNWNPFSGQSPFVPAAESDKVNVTSFVRDACNGEYTCAYKIDAGKIGDPAYGSKKEFRVEWTCGTESTVYTKVVPAEASGQTVNLTCGPKLTIKSATWGPNCNVKAGAHTAAVAAACDGKRRCDWPLSITGDPAFGCNKNMVVDYVCGDSTKTQTYTFPTAQQNSPISFGCEYAANIKVTSATFGENCKVTKGKHTTAVGAVCDGVSTCEFDFNSKIAENTGGCFKKFEAKYKCGDAPTEYTVSYPVTSTNYGFFVRDTGDAQGPAKMTCAGVSAKSPPPFVSTGRKACIPKECAWNTKRDTDMSCKTDTTKPFIDSFKILGYKLVDYTDRTVRDIGTDKKIATVYENTPYRFNAQVAMTGPPVNTRLSAWFTDRYEHKTTKALVDGFVCVAANLGVNKEKTGLQRLTTTTFSDIFSEECVSKAKTSAGDAAFRLGIKESDFRANYTFVGTKLHFSFDPEGKLGFSAKGLAQQKTAAPNPIGFFFDAKKGWVDQLSYYQQREIPTADDGTAFDKRTFAFASPTTIELRTQGSVDVRDGATLPLRLFSVSDPPPITINFDWAQIGDTGTNPWGGEELDKKNPRMVVHIFPGGKENEAVQLGKPIPLRKGNATGNLTTATFIMGDTAKDKIFGDWLAYDTFDIRTCMEVDGLGGNGYTSKIKYLGADYDMFLNQILKCNTTKDAVFVVRDFLKRPIEPQHATANVGNTKTNEQGDKKSSGDAEQGQEQNCIETGDGSSRKSICTTTRVQTSGGEGGTGARTFYSTESGTRIVNSDGTLTVSADEEAEALGMQVVDVDDEENEKGFAKEGDYPKGDGFEIKIAPNWDLIVQTLRKIPEPVPEWTKGRYGGRMGLGVGIAYKIPLQFGPVPVIVVLTASVGVSLELQFKGKFKPETEYPCINTTGNKCFAVVTTPASQVDAARKCAVKGGRLAEMITANDRAVIASAATANQNYWIGAQGAYDFSGGGPTCYRRQNDGDCKNNSRTSWRWTGSDTEFAKSTGTSNTLTATPGGTVVPTSDMVFSSIVPLNVGVVYHGTQRKLGTTGQSTSLPYVCEFDGASKATYSEFSAGLALGAGAGFGIAACTPSDEIGVCIDGSFNVVDLSLTPTITYSSFTLFGNDTYKVGNQSYKKTIGKRGNTNFGVPWELNLFTGSVNATVNFYIGSVSWKIAGYDGFKVAAGNLYSYDWPTREDYR